MLKRVLFVCVLVGFVVAMITAAGCNTVRGFGKDVQEGGQAIEKVAH